MKAVIVRTPGGPQALELTDLPLPEPGPGEVRVRAHAIGVGRPDVLIRQGTYKWMPPLPAIPGNEVAGVVEALGQGARGVATLAPLTAPPLAPEDQWIGKLDLDGFESGQPLP